MPSDKKYLISELLVTETRRISGKRVNQETRTSELVLKESETDQILASYTFDATECTDHALTVSPDGFAVLVSYGVTVGEYAAHRAVVLEIDMNLGWKVLLDETQLPESTRAIQKAPFIDWTDRLGHSAVGIRWVHIDQLQEHYVWQRADRSDATRVRIMQWATIVRVVEIQEKYLSKEETRRVLDEIRKSKDEERATIQLELESIKSELPPDKERFDIAIFKKLYDLTNDDGESYVTSEIIEELEVSYYLKNKDIKTMREFAKHKEFLDAHNVG